jgi:NAD(P)H-hydrate repair Nnr-like enzyme with NAD(P)H-hydrate dehydratase domain
VTAKQQPTEISEAMVAGLLPARDAGAHKWGVGGLVIVAGGPTYIGAAALAAMAAGRAGAGIVQIATPRGAIGAIASLVPEAVFIPLRDGEAGPAARAAIEAIQPKLERSKAMLVGPGLGQDEHAEALLAAVFGFASTSRPTAVGFHRRVSETGKIAQGEGIISVDRPTVVDADGLNWLAKHPDWFERVPAGSLILTPHAGEMGRLLDRPVEEILSDPVQLATDAASRWNQVVVLKVGATVATDGEKAVIADDAPVSLATAGSGDVFSGFIAGLLAQGVSALDAAAIAMYAGSRAARRVEERFGVRGLVAGDLPAAMAEAIAALDA